MIKIFHFPMTRSIRIIWLCEELEVPYEVVGIDFSREYRASPEWRELNPVGKVPAMADDGFTMFESGAMVQYILDRYGDGRLQPAPGTAESAHYLQWCWFAEATLARPLGDMAQHTRIKPEAERIPAVVEDGRQRARLCLEAVDHALEGHEFLMGDVFTAADIMMGYSLLLGRRVGALEDRDANVNRYLAGLEARPTCQKATADSR